MLDTNFLEFTWKQKIEKWFIYKYNDANKFLAPHI